MAFHSSSEISSVARITAKPPALLTRTSTRPQRARTAAKRTADVRRSCHVGGEGEHVGAPSAQGGRPASPRRHRRGRARPPCAPSRTHASTMAAPIPLAAPVTMTTFPSSRMAAPFAGVDRTDSIHGAPVLVLARREGDRMGRFVDLSVTVDSSTMSPPSTNMRARGHAAQPGPGFWQVSSVHQSLHTGAHIDSPLHVFKNGITTAEISLDQVMGEALVVDLSWAGPNHRDHHRRSQEGRRRRRQAR